MTPTMERGRHAGKPMTRVPVNYLLWMVNVGHSQAVDARAELDRRGTVVPTLDVSGHAIDRASQQLLGYWQRDHRENEGLHAWLVRIAAEALEHTPADAEGIVRHRGIRFVFEPGVEWPTLKTVIREKRRRRAA